MADGMTGETLTSLWDAVASRNAERTFLVHVGASGEERYYTYDRFSALARQTARAFAAAGVGRGDMVCVHLTNCVEYLLCLFGLARLGAVMVPVNEQSTQEECAFVVRMCRPKAVVTQRRFADAYRDVLRDAAASFGLVLVDGAEEPGEVDFHSALARASETGTAEEASDVGLAGAGARCHENAEGRAASAAGPDDVAEVMFTSGTTAAPKGVELTHANLVCAARYGQWQMCLCEDDVVFTTMPACHSNFQLAALMPVLAAGCELVMVEKYSASRFWSQARRHNATVVQAISMMVKTLLMQPASPLDAANDVRDVQYFLPLPTRDKEEFERRFGVRVLNDYGSTETVNWVVCDTPTARRRWPAAGRVGIGYQVRVVDGAGHELPDGEAGDVQVKGVRGRTLMKGYFHDPKATAAVFEEDGWMSTGDKGRFDQDGFFYFVDRKSNMIKRSGENVSAAEVEDVIARDPRVSEAAVIGVPDPVRDQAVKAFVVPAEGASLTEGDVKAWCSARLAAFKVPTQVELRGSLPHTASMKVEKKLLR